MLPTRAAGRQCRSRARSIPTAPAAPRRRAAAPRPEWTRSVSWRLGFFGRRVHQPLDADHVILVATVEQQRGAVARPRQRDRDDLLDAAGGARHHRDAVGEVYGLLDAVGHEQHGLAIALPDVEQVVLQAGASLRIERAEWLVHQ